MGARHVGAGSPRLVERTPGARSPWSAFPRHAALALAALAVATLALAARADAFIYWTNFAPPGSIGRANTDGTGAKQDFITGATQPQGVASPRA
jgi:hypothetical protein